MIGRLPEAVDETIVLLDGVYPGCCHRGAGDIFRLEGESPLRTYLAPEIVEGLKFARQQRMAHSGPGGGCYTFQRQRDGLTVQGAHCLYFGVHGCLLGDLKGPLCLNFICPPMRSDLLAVCAGDESLVGPEHDFLCIYRSLAIVSYDDPATVARELADLGRRVRLLSDRCAVFLAERPARSLYAFFNEG